MGYYASSSSPQEISIHVPREGDDIAGIRLMPPFSISIHVPREGDDSWRTSPGHSPTTFQSTSPVRGTTLKIYDTPKELTISIHVPREGDDFTPCDGEGAVLISIHVPREGDDYFFLRGPLRVKNFNPRPP